MLFFYSIGREHINISILSIYMLYVLLIVNTMHVVLFTSDQEISHRPMKCEHALKRHVFLFLDTSPPCFFSHAIVGVILTNWNLTACKFFWITFSIKHVPKGRLCYADLI